MTNRISDELARVAAEALADGILTADEVLSLRQGVYKDGVVNREEAEFLFHLDGESTSNDDAWADFFVQSLTDYFVTHQHPTGVLSKEDGEFLVDRFIRDGRVDRRTEFELLLAIVEQAKSCPETVVSLLLNAVRETVLKGGGILFGPARRRAGIIDEYDVDVIRRVLYGTGGGGGFTVNRAEAEMLFDLNDATVEKENAPTWQELFVVAVGNYLMFPRGPQLVIGAEEYTRRQGWLESRGNTVSFLVSVAKAAGELDVRDQARAWVDREETESANSAATESARAEEARSRGAIDEAEAAWLIGRISRDDVIHKNERALLAYIKKQAPEIHPSLEPWLDKAGL